MEHRSEGALQLRGQVFFSKGWLKLANGHRNIRCDRRQYYGPVWRERERAGLVLVGRRPLTLE